MINSTELTQIIRRWMDIFASRSMHDWMRYVKTSGLSMPQLGILMNLYYRHTFCMSDISGRMDITPGAASQLVEKLVQSGLVERTEDPSDRRAKLLALTDKGRSVIETSIEARASWVDELVGTLTPGEYETVAAALDTLTQAAQRIEIKKPEKMMHFHR
jgi:DNA-binding MarR family transcriptional regulator